MKETRRTLIKNIYETFRKSQYPCFIGMKGLGKHQVIESFAKEYRYEYQNLKELPNAPSILYICDTLEPQFLKELTVYLLQDTQDYKICFIYNDFPPIELSELISLKMKMFYAPDFLLTYSDTKTLLKSEGLENHYNLYQKTLGNLYAISHCLHYDTEMLFQDHYFQTYLGECFQTLTSKEKDNLSLLATYPSVEKEIVKDVLCISIDSLIKKGFCIETDYKYTVPEFIRNNIKHNDVYSHQIFEYYYKQKCYVKAFRYASKQEKEILKDVHIHLACLLENHELELLDTQDFLSKAIIYFRQHRQDKLQELLSNHVIDHDYMRVLLLLENIDLSQWIKDVQHRQFKIHLPSVLFMNGFLKNQLYLGKLMENQQLYQEWLSILDESSIQFMYLLECEDAIEKNQLRIAKKILSDYPIDNKEDLEVQYLKTILSIRIHLIEGYQEDMIKIPLSLYNQIIKRDDMLSRHLELFEIEKAIILNKQDILSEYYMLQPDIEQSLYAQLIYISVLYKLKLYEKSIYYIQQFLNQYTYHSYIYSHLKYLYALNLKALNKETQSLIELSESLSFNGPLRYSSYYSYFGQDTIQLMTIYIHFIEEADKRKRKQYYKATQIDEPITNDYNTYIQSIIENAKIFSSHKSTTLISLTPQEMRILEYIEQGYTNLQIAEAMSIRIPTVKTHISNIYSKLGVKNRAGAIKTSRELGM